LNKGTVHIVSAALWGTYGILTGTIGVITGHFNFDLMVSEVVAISGNSLHLVAFSLSKEGITVSSSDVKKT
jgi:hypothetical protein